MLIRRLFAALALWGVWLLPFVPALHAEQSVRLQPGNIEHFSMTPEELINAFADVKNPKSSGVVLLLMESRYSFDAQGRSVSSRYLIYKVMSPAAVDEWSRVQQSWSPWYQERPQIRARVITEDRSELVLDPDTIAEAPAIEISPDIYSDRQVLRAPLPGVNAGSIVEEEVIVREKKPFYRDGTVRFFPLVSAGPVQLARLILEAPPSLPLRYVVRQAPSLKPQKTETSQEIRMIFEAGPMDAYEAPESGLPRNVPPYPYVAFSTGASWARLAAYYSSVVEERIRDANLDGIVDGIIDETTDRKAIAEKLLAWIQKNIRYTGLRFGQAPIAPMKPAETLAHKYGDCKDKSALLIAMLRAAGIPAHIALLRSGSGPEVEPELPGLSAFNHAVVYVQGNPPLWIDPTYDFARVGELPVSDRDRLALVADAATVRLVKTPPSESDKNFTLETREFFLSDIGPSRVNETTEWHGEGEMSARYYYLTSTRDTLQNELNRYAEQNYLAKGNVKFEYGNPGDLAKPFELRLEVGSAERGITVENEAVVAIFCESIADQLPWEFLYGNEQIKSETQSDGAEKRKYDYVFETPFVTEWRYRIVPPPGFRVDSFPESETIRLGSAEFSSEFAVNDGGVVTGRLRFDSGKRQISPTEFQLMKTAVVEFTDSEPLIIRFTQIGMEHLASGRIREAIAEFKRLLDLYPDKAHYRSLMAKALIEAGLGDAARKAAHAAVEMEPKSAFAYQTLGYVLQHDLVGRMFKKGFDYDGALAAYKKAKQIDPENAEITVSLAILLEHDKDGVRYSKASRLDEAIEEYNSLPGYIRNEYANNLLVALVQGHRFAELKDASKDFEDTALVNQMLIIATAITDDLKSAIDLGKRLFSLQETRSEAFEIAGNTLSQLRLYPEASELLREAAKGAANGIELRTLADVRRKTRRYDSIDLPDEDPGTVAKKLIIAMFLPQERKRYPFSSLFVSDLAEEFPEGDDGLRQVVGMLRTLADRSGVSMEFIVDTLVSNLKTRIEGDDNLGYKIQLQMLSNVGLNSLDLFVIREKDGYRILGLVPEYEAVGNEAMRRIDNYDISGARRLLNWVREFESSPGGDDPFEGNPFPKLWPRYASGDELRIRAASASLMVDGIFSEKAEKALLSVRDEWTSGVDRAAVDHALALVYYNLKRYEDLLKIADRLYQSNPKSRGAFLLCMNGLLGLERYSDAKRLAEERLKIFPNDPTPIRILASLASKEGYWKKVDRLLRRLVDSGKAEAEDYNNLAWNTLFEGTVTEQAFEDARNAVTLSNQLSATYLHTLASLYAEAGRTMEAREAIVQSIEVSGKEGPDSDDWYVFGRIAEDFNLAEAAASAYAKVKEVRPRESPADSTYALAKQRLAILGNR